MMIRLRGTWRAAVATAERTLRSVLRTLPSRLPGYVPPGDAPADARRTPAPPPVADDRVGAII